MNNKVVLSAVAISIFLVIGFTISVSAQTVGIDIGATATYGGTITVSGYIIPNPGANQEVDVAVNNPNGVTVLNSVVGVNAVNGAYSYSSPAGGSSAWVNGTYTATATWGTLTATYTNSTTFKYGSTGTTTTTTTSSSSTPTTVTTTVTSTVSTTSTATITQTQTQTQTQITTQPTTVSTTIPTTVTTTQPTTVSTTVTGPTVTSTTTAASITWVAIGVGGIVAAIFLAVFAVLMMRRH